MFTAFFIPTSPSLFSSPSLHSPPLLLPSVVMIAFNQPQYTLAEGDMTEVTVSVMSGHTLERDVTVTVETGGSGTAGMVHVIWREEL